jgi:hypothetical protein
LCISSQLFLSHSSHPTPPRPITITLHPIPRWDPSPSPIPSHLVPPRPTPLPSLLGDVNNRRVVSDDPEQLIWLEELKQRKAQLETCVGGTLRQVGDFAGIPEISPISRILSPVREIDGITSSKPRRMTRVARRLGKAVREVRSARLPYMEEGCHIRKRVEARHWRRWKGLGGTRDYYKALLESGMRVLRSCGYYTHYTHYTPLPCTQPTHGVFQTPSSAPASILCTSHPQHAPSSARPILCTSHPQHAPS